MAPTVTARGTRRSDAAAAALPLAGSCRLALPADDPAHPTRTQCPRHVPEAGRGSKRRPELRIPGQSVQVNVKHLKMHGLLNSGSRRRPAFYEPLDSNTLDLLR